MITDDGNTTKAVTVVGVKVEEATAVAERVVGVAAVVEVEVGVAVAEVGAEATAVAEVGVRVVEATAAEDFSQRHRSQQDEKEKRVLYGNTVFLKNKNKINIALKIIPKILLIAGRPQRRLLN